MKRIAIVKIRLIVSKIFSSSYACCYNCVYYFSKERDEKRELLSMFGPKCSPRRGAALKRVFSHAETDSLGADTKVFPEKTENTKWYMIGDPLTIDRCSRIGFPLTFFAFNCIYWLVHTKS